MRTMANGKRIQNNAEKQQRLTLIGSIAKPRFAICWLSNVHSTVYNKQQFATCTIYCGGTQESRPCQYDQSKHHFITTVL